MSGPIGQSGAGASIIVVAFNSRDHFPQLKAALQAQTAQGFELIVFDNASHADQRPKADDFPNGAILLQSEQNLGFAGANNLAAMQATRPNLVLLNPDAFPESDWLAALLAARRRWPHSGAIGSTQISVRNPSVYDGLGDAYHILGAAWRGGYGRPRTSIAPADAETFSVCAAAALYPRAVWDAVGGFEERYFCFHEDVDLGFRMRLLGWPSYQAKDAVVRHQGGGSTGLRSDFANFHGLRNTTWTFVRNMPMPLFWPLLPLHLGLMLVLATVHLATGRGFAGFRGVGAALVGLPWALAQRSAIQKRRRAGTAELVRVMALSPLPLIDRRPVLRPFDDRAHFGSLPGAKP